MMSGEGSGPAPVGDNGKGPTMLERHRDRIEKVIDTHEKLSTKPLRI